MQIIPMLSWDFIHTGGVSWDDAGQPTYCDTPAGIELKVNPAGQTGPLFEFDQPWEQQATMIGWAQVFEDDGLYRLYYGIIDNSDAGKEEYLCYAESEDTVNWHKPVLNQVEWQGSKANNIVLHADGCSHACVMRDPESGPDIRYRCWLFKSWWEGEPGEILTNNEGHRRLNVNNAATEGEPHLPVSLKGAMYGYNSPDGFRWLKLAEPILDEWHDTHNICMYDSARKKYVGYFRGFYGGRRAISYSETEDFAHWPPTRTIHHHLAEDSPGDSLYSNCFTPYPGYDVKLMFPAVFHQADDSVDGQLAVSLDAINWTRHSGQAIIPRTGLEQGHVYPEPQLLRVKHLGKFRLLVKSGGRYHNQWYNEALRSQFAKGSFSWAEWDEDRLCGIHAADHGQFTTNGIKCGDRLLANYRTEPDGWIRFELCERVVYPPIRWPGITGFTFDQSDKLAGDETHAPVSWQGSSETSAFRNKTVYIRVKLYKATLFSLTVYGADDPAIKEDPRFPV